MTRTSPDRIVDVFVPVDSAYVRDASRRVGTRIEVNVSPASRCAARASRSAALDTTMSGLRSIVVTPGPDTSRFGPFRKSPFLGRAFLPYGDWRSGWHSGLHGAISIELRAGHDTFAWLIREAPGWFFSNIFTVGLLLALTTLAGAIEGLAVRSGRTIVSRRGRSRTAAHRRRAHSAPGPLHRVPVKGRDELSALAGSFNDMAASLERQRTELIEKERIEEDLEVARQIQRRFLPQRVPSWPGSRWRGYRCRAARWAAICTIT
jgi:HAMP domain-containing protein